MKNSVNVDLNKCPDERCECGSPFFVTKTIVKRIPGIMIASSEDLYQPVPFLACEICAKPHRSTKVVVPEYETKGEA